MRILVTGGAGFIGAHLTQRLIAKGHEVFVLDNLSVGRKENVPEGAKLVVGDVRSVEDLKKIDGVDAVFHLAAQISVIKSIENPAETMDINVKGTVNVLDTFKDVPIVYVSSAAVYGNSKELPIKETCPSMPLSPYGWSKLCSEEFCRLQERQYNTKVAIARLFNVYGPGQNPNNPYTGVITKFMTAAKEDKTLQIYGDGTQTRDYIYVDDVCDALLILLGKKGTYNIGTGIETSVNELAELIKEINKKELKIEHLPPRKGEIARSVADISKMKEIGWEPKTDLKKGLSNML